MLCNFAAAEAIHKVPIFIPLGTHYCWVDTGSADSMLAQHDGNQTPDLLISGPMPQPLGHALHIYIVSVSPCDRLTTDQMPDMCLTNKLNCIIGTRFYLFLISERSMNFHARSWYTDRIEP